MSYRYGRKSGSNISPRRRLVLWAAGPGRKLVVPLAVVLLASLAALFAWKQVAGRVTSGEDYYVDPQQIEITVPPRWVRSDVKQEVIQRAGLDAPLWLFDDDLSRRIADQFLLHPWVAEVREVRKQHPSRIVVELIYRQPVAMVAKAQAAALWPVDVQGVVLPRQDFSDAEAARYPLLAGVSSTPPGPVGTVWRDPIVLDGAQIAAALLEHWQTLQLYKIVASESDDSLRGGRRERTYDLITNRGRRIPWGHAPGHEMQSESTAQQKVAALVDFVNRYQSLDAAATVPRLDPRLPATGDPRTAKLNESGTTVQRQ